MKKWMAVMLLIVVVLFGSVIGFNLFKQHEIAKYLANMPIKANPVTVMTAKPQNWLPTIDAIGFIEPNQGVDVSNAVQGKVSQILFKSGQRVHKGQVLIELDSAIEQANLQSSLGTLPATKAAYERLKQLYQQKSVSKTQLDKAESDYRALQGKIASQRATLDLRKIRAPFDGIVGIRNVFLGQFLQPGTSIVRLEDTNVMHIRFSIPQTDFAKIELGQTIKIYVDSYPNHPFKGEISAIDPAVNKQSGVISIQANIPNSDGKLLAGMFAQVQVSLPALKDQLLVPQTAISFNLYGQTLYIVKPSKNKEGKEFFMAEQRLVTVSDRKGDLARVTSGLKTGEQVVTSGQVRLSNGSHVRIVKDDTLATPDSIPML